MCRFFVWLAISVHYPLLVTSDSEMPSLCLFHIFPTGLSPPFPFHSEYCMWLGAYFSCKGLSKKLIWCQTLCLFLFVSPPCSLLVVVWWEALLLMCVRSWQTWYWSDPVFMFVYRITGCLVSGDIIKPWWCGA